MRHVELPPLDGPGSNANDFMSWLQTKPDEDLARSAQALFEKILNMASQPRNATKDACVKLCGFVQLCAKSEHEALTQWAFQEATAKDLFDYYLEWNEKDQHRSMRLVLDLVAVLILQNADSRVRESLKTQFLSTLVSIIFKQSTRPVVKSCISALTVFLTKSVYDLEDLAHEYKSVRTDVAVRSGAALWEAWVVQIFNWMELHYICPVAGKFLVTLFSALYHQSATVEQPQLPLNGALDAGILRKWLETAVSSNPDIFETVKNYVLAPLFKSDRALSIALLKELNNTIPEGQTGSAGGEDVTALLRLAALEVGKKSSIVDDPSPVGAKPAENVVILDRNVLNHYLIHPSHAVRSFAMSLLIASSSTTKPYSAMTFELLKQHLRSCHADPDAKFRNEILAHEKNMVKRIKGAISVLQKDIQRLAIKASKAKADGTPVNTHISQGAKHIANAGEIWLRDSLHAHEEFSRWYLAFLQHELVPTASFQRHSTALKSLVNIVKLSKDSSSFSGECIFRDPQWIRILLDLVMDPFDDVRQTAVGLLMLCPVEITRESMAYGNSQPDSTPLTILTEFYDKAASLASRTSRADHSDGTARSLGLLCAWQDTLDARVSLVSKTLDGLEQKIMAAEEDLGHAVMFVPVHGDFAAIRCMWEVLSQLENRYTDEEQQALGRLQQRIATLCARIWNTVSYVLCDDSPEGHLPEELEEIEGLDTKGLLSYSFRAIYESSNLMRTIVANLRFYRAAGFLLPPPQVFEAIGNLAFTQLSTLRHRGAFSSVSLTFTTCCQHARDPPVASPVGEKSLLAIWYEGTLACIQTQRSTTRRSAGIPALMTGILASNADSPSFKEVMRTLQDIAAQPAHVSETDGSNLPQVHAFNCIKEVFKTSLLSKNAEAYLPECLQLATSSLKSGVWAIRNCALLLLRSLIDTLFGTSESKSAMETGWDGKTLRLSYTKYATLPPILLNLLQSGEQAMEPSTLSSQSSAAESVFPALEIIRRAGPPESNRDELFGYITEYLGSRQWHVREIAARTLCSFLLSGDWLAAIKTLLSESRGSANRVHGTLLTIKFFLERKLVEKTDKCSDAGIEQLVHALAASEGTFLLCSETAATYAEILNLLSSFDLLQVSTSAQTQLTATTDPSTRDGCYKSIALLTDRLGVMRLRRAAASADLQALELCLVDVLNKDIDTACALLQAVPIVWVDGQMSKLCGLYLRLCKYTTVPEVRAVALTNLAGLLDAFIANNDLQTLPHPDELDDLQHALQDTINPALANAILLASGSIMALHTVPHHHQLSFVTFEQRLRSWGKAISDALNESNTFDMRMAATRALKSFLTALRNAVGDEAAYIPCLLALYTTLVDDDEDIRALGAEAAAFVITEDASVRRPQPLVAVDAADALLAWLQSHFGRTNEFRAYVACRLVGDPLIAVDIGVQDLSAWRAQKEAFDEALEVDESLFAVEEQNLFIDEVRETERWAVVFGALEWDYDEIEEEDGTVSRVLMMDSSLSALKGWTEEGLRCLTQHATKKDGPLGWASTADAFALCHRVLVCSRMMSKVLGSEDQRVIETLQGDIQRMGLQERLHGLLLSAL